MSLADEFRQYAVNDDGTKKYHPDGSLIDYSKKGDYIAKVNALKNKYYNEGQEAHKKERESPVSTWIARELTKPVFKGLMAIPDMPVALNNLILSGVNKFGGTDLGYLKYPSDYVGDALDYVTEERSKGEPNSIPAKAIEFGASMLGGGLAGKALKAAAPSSKVASYLGSTKVGDIATASAMGGITQTAEDMGLDAITAAGVGIAGGLGASAIGNRLLKNKVSNFNLPAYEAAEKESLDLPKIALDQTDRSKLARTVAEHTMYAGKKLGEQANRTNQSFADAFERNLNKVSTKKTLENQELCKKLYQEAENALTSQDLTSPNNMLKAVRVAEKNIAENSLLNTAKQEQYKKYLGKLQEATMDVTRLNPDPNKIGVEIRKLINQKQQINNQISKLPHEEWALKEELINVRNAIKKDIEVYAQTNPMFKKKWTEAEGLYGKMEKRVDLNKSLGLKEELNNSTDFNPRTVAKNYLNVKHDPAFVKMVGGKENLQHFDDIVTAVKALPTSKVSTLAKNMKVMSMLSGSIPALVGVATNGLTGGAIGAGYTVGSEILIQLLSKKNSKSLKKLAEYAKNQTPENAKKVNNTYKKEFGMSVEEVNNSLENVIKNSRKAKIRVGGEEMMRSAEKNRDEKYHPYDDTKLYPVDASGVKKIRRKDRELRKNYEFGKYFNDLY